jgi:hypothetical protein
LAITYYSYENEKYSKEIKKMQSGVKGSPPCLSPASERFAPAGLY